MLIKTMVLRVADSLVPYVEIPHRPLKPWEAGWLTEAESFRAGGFDPRFEEVPDQLWRQPVNVFTAAGSNCSALGIPGLRRDEVLPEFPLDTTGRQGSAHRQVKAFNV